MTVKVSGRGVDNGRGGGGGAGKNESSERKQTHIHFEQWQMHHIAPSVVIGVVNLLHRMMSQPPTESIPTVTRLFVSRFSGKTKG